MISLQRLIHIKTVGMKHKGFNHNNSMLGDVAS